MIPPQVTIFLLQYVGIPVAKALVSFGMKKLRKAKDGIPKKMALEIIEIIADNEANPLTHNDIPGVKEILGYIPKP